MKWLEPKRFLPVVCVSVLVGMACQSAEPSDKEEESVPTSPSAAEGGAGGASSNEPSGKLAAQSAALTGQVVLQTDVSDAGVKQRSFVGPAQARSGNPVVECVYAPADDDGTLARFRVTAGFAQEEAAIHLELVGGLATPGSHQDVGVSPNGDIFLRLQTGTEDNGQVLEYGLDSQRFGCSVLVSRLDARAVGEVSCPVLTPTGRSADSGASPISVTRGTVAFDCDLTLGIVVEPEGLLLPSVAEVSPAACVGPYVSCTVTPKTECLPHTGCAWMGRCGGYPTSCSSHATQLVCDQESGCEWSSDSQKCAGPQAPCDEAKLSFECLERSGCTWQEGCSGSAHLCAAFTKHSACELMPQCDWLFAGESIDKED